MGRRMIGQMPESTEVFLSDLCVAFSSHSEHGSAPLQQAYMHMTRRCPRNTKNRRSACHERRGRPTHTRISAQHVEVECKDRARVVSTIPRSEHSSSNWTKGQLTSAGQKQKQREPRRQRDSVSSHTLPPWRSMRHPGRGPVRITCSGCLVSGVGWQALGWYFGSPQVASMWHESQNGRAPWRPRCHLRLLGGLGRRRVGRRVLLVRRRAQGDVDHLDAPGPAVGRSAPAF